MHPVLEQLAEHARRRPEETAVTQVIPCTRRTSWSWRQLHEVVNAVAAQLRPQVEPGGVVMLSSPNRPEFVAAFLGVIAADGVVFPVHPSLTGAELRHTAHRSTTRMLISSIATRATMASPDLRFLDIDLLTSLESANQRSGDAQGHAGLMLQSSGTTGLPKVVHRSGRSLAAVAANVCEATQLSQADRSLVAIPLGHSYGVESGLLAPVMAGAALHLMEGFDPAIAIEQLSAAGITVFPGVPFMWQALAERSPDMRFPHLRLAYSAGGPLPQAVFDRCANGMNVRIGQLYGSTEIGSATFNDPHEPGHEPGSVGRAMRDVDVLVLDPDALDPAKPLSANHEGHVAVRSPSMLDRYVNDLTPPLHQDYFLTGDLGRLDHCGRLTITGRVKLQFDVGGLKINPLEIEHVLGQHPLVKECVVISIPMTDTVERLKALVVLDDSSRSFSTESLRDFVRHRLAAHKVPRVFEVRTSLPRSATGKILRGRLQCD